MEEEWNHTYLETLKLQEEIINKKLKINIKPIP